MTMVDRFTSIIDVFDDTATGLSLDQVASRAALPRSTTHRILDHLVRLRWVRHGEDGYGLGARAISWGAGDVTDLRLRGAAAPILHRLFVRTGAVAQLGVLVAGSGGPAGYQVVHVDKLGGASAERVPTRVGTTLDARRLALGVAMLAALPPECAPDVRDVDLDRVRHDGGVVWAGDYAPGLTSVAAAVDDRAAVGIVLPDDGSRDAGERHLPLLRSAAARVRAELNPARSASA